MKTAVIALTTVATSLLAFSLHAEQPGAKTSASTTTSSKLCDFAALDKKPTPINRVQPLYPAALKAARVTGEAVIVFVVDVDGSVKNARVERATEPDFGEAALAAVTDWTFEPGTKDGTPVACQLSIPLRFTLSK